MLPRIFIGGIGRSGTTILYKALGCHKDVYALPTEMRFLVAPDGLINLLDALTVRYSLVQARQALFQFERLMRVYLTTPQRAPYPGFDFPSWLGGDYYWRRLDQFCSELVELEFSGPSWELESANEGMLTIWARRLQKLGQRLLRHPVVPTRLTLPRTQLKVVKYFPDRSHLMKLAAAFVDDLFLNAARERGKQTWCEKTPHNHLHLDFLWELFPQSVIIIIKRDPRGVVHSLTKQDWAPNDVRGACLFLRSVYNRYFDVKGAIDLNRYRYLELKLEDLAASPQSALERIASFCGLQNPFENLPDITIDRVNYWQRTMTSQEIQLVNEILGSYIERMGYEI